MLYNLGDMLGYCNMFFAYTSRRSKKRIRDNMAALDLSAFFLLPRQGLVKRKCNYLAISGCDVAAAYPRDE